MHEQQFSCFIEQIINETVVIEIIVLGEMINFIEKPSVAETDLIFLKKKKT